MAAEDFDFDALASILTTLATQWNNLSADDKAVFTDKFDGIDGDWGSGTDDKSEFETRGDWFNAVSLGLTVAGASATLGIVTAPVGAALITAAGVFKLFAVLASQMTVERTVKLSAWLSDKAPQFMAILCANPAMIYGIGYTLNPDGPWYLISTCPGINYNAVAGVVANPFPNLENPALQADNVPSFPWLFESNSSTASSSTSGGKALIGLGLVGLAALALG